LAPPALWRQAIKGLGTLDFSHSLVLADLPHERGRTHEK
jgi:hypothetical protein